MFHRHKWVVVAANKMNLYDRPWGWEKPGVIGQVTDVLYRCDCGKVKTKEIEGHWTTEQLRGTK